MEVFIGKLAANTTHTDLVRFLKGFSGKARISIVEKQQPDGNIARYGIAEFDSDKLALKAIRKLDGQRLCGERMVVREYFYRCYANERRAVNWRHQPWSGVERRKQERRKQQSRNPAEQFDQIEEGTDAELETFRISAYAHLARKS